MAHQQWEYRSLFPKEDVQTVYTTDGGQREAVPDLDVAIAQLGEEGWELVAINPAGTMYFKRPKQDERGGLGFFRSS